MNRASLSKSAAWLHSTCVGCLWSEIISSQQRSALCVGQQLRWGGEGNRRDLNAKSHFPAKVTDGLPVRPPYSPSILVHFQCPQNECARRAREGACTVQRENVQRSFARFRSAGPISDKQNRNSETRLTSADMTPVGTVIIGHPLGWGEGGGEGGLQLTGDGKTCAQLKRTKHQPRVRIERPLFLEKADRSQNFLFGVREEERNVLQLVGALYCQEKVWKNCGRGISTLRPIITFAMWSRRCSKLMLLKAVAPFPAANATSAFTVY